MRIRNIKNVFWRWMAMSNDIYIQIILNGDLVQTMLIRLAHTVQLCVWHSELKIPDYNGFC